MFFTRALASLRGEAGENNPNNRQPSVIDDSSSTPSSVEQASSTANDISSISTPVQSSNSTGDETSTSSLVLLANSVKDETPTPLLVPDDTSIPPIDQLANNSVNDDLSTLGLVQSASDGVELSPLSNESSDLAGARTNADPPTPPLAQRRRSSLLNDDLSRPRILHLSNSSVVVNEESSTAAPALVQLPNAGPKLLPQYYKLRPKAKTVSHSSSCIFFLYHNAAVDVVEFRPRNGPAGTCTVAPL